MDQGIWGGGWRLELKPDDDDAVKMMIVMMMVMMMVMMVMMVMIMVVMMSNKTPPTAFKVFTFQVAGSLFQQSVHQSISYHFNVKFQISIMKL